MDRTRFGGRVVAAGRRSHRLHSKRISAQYGAHLAAVLIVFLALPVFAADSIEFDPNLLQEDFNKFSRLLAQGLYSSPVSPAMGAGLLRFDIGIAATIVPVDTGAAYWRNSVGDDFSTSGYVGVPRLVVSKGIGIAAVAGTYAQIPDTDLSLIGGSVDVALIDGGLIKPTLAIRGTYAQLQGVDVYDLNTYGVELCISKVFGPITPYGSIGRSRSSAEGRLQRLVGGDMVELARYTDNADGNRLTAGVRISLLVPKIVIEATQAEEMSYSAKLSFGF